MVIQMKKIKNKKYTILIERYKHICNSQLHSIKDLKNEKKNAIKEDNIK